MEEEGEEEGEEAEGVEEVEVKMEEAEEEVVIVDHSITEIEVYKYKC